MATTPPLSPSIAATKTSRVEGWIRQLSKPALGRANDLSPPSTPENGPSLKRKRVTSASVTYTMSTRTTSPKRPRRGTDTEVLPTHSVSAAGAASNASALMLNERITFSPPSSQAGTTGRSPRRANSPSRDNIAVLASASPPTITEPSSGLKTPPPRRVIWRGSASIDTESLCVIMEACGSIPQEPFSVFRSAQNMTLNMSSF
jgi:hypothetical protein